MQNEDFIARNQAEVNALMEEYWKLRAHCGSSLILRRCQTPERTC